MAYNFNNKTGLNRPSFSGLNEAVGSVGGLLKGAFDKIRGRERYDSQIPSNLDETGLSEEEYLNLVRESQDASMPVDEYGKGVQDHYDNFFETSVGDIDIYADKAGGGEEGVGAELKRTIAENDMRKRNDLGEMTDLSNLSIANPNPEDEEEFNFANQMMLDSEPNPFKRGANSLLSMLRGIGR